MIRVALPQHLRTLAHVQDEEALDAGSVATRRNGIIALEARHPMLRGTIRDQQTQARRPFLRYFACQEDLSHEAPDVALPAAVSSGEEPLMIVGAISGG